MKKASRSAIGIFGLTVGLGLALGSASFAGSEPPFPIDDIASLDPANEDFDVEQADEEFNELAALVAASAGSFEPTSGSSLVGPCGGFAFSYNEAGERIDAAIDLGDGGPPIDLMNGGQAFTSGNPFKVDTQGVVTYFGFMPQTGDGPMGHSWTIKTSNVSIDSGGDPNTAGNNRNAGIVNLKDDLPFKFSAKVQIDGSLTSENLPECSGDGYVEFQGDGLVGPLGLVGLALLGGAIAGLLFNARPAMTFKV